MPSCLFANVAAERQLPEITGYRLMKRGGANALDSGALLALPPPGPAPSTALALYRMPALTPEEWARAKNPKKLGEFPKKAKTLGT